MTLLPKDLEEVRSLCAARRHADALKLCGDFIAEHRDHPHGYHMRAVVRVLMGEPHLALADRDRVVSLCPREPGAYMARADDHLRLGDFAAAAADLDRAEKFDDGHYWPMIPLLRAQCHARLGRFAEALADLERVPDGYLLPDFTPGTVSSKRQLEAEIEALQAQRPVATPEHPAS
jgi:tetratricopeptide (TPR) repeat protein